MPVEMPVCAALAQTLTCKGVIPTPGVAYLVRKYGADAGIVISASHNPMESTASRFQGRWLQAAR
jgi:Phosphomannomutase